MSLHAESPFSTCTQGENRVTSTVITVLGHVNNKLAEDILEALTDESDLSLVSFDNQVTGVDSVPDAAIKSLTTSDSDRTVAFIQGHQCASFTKLWENPEHTIKLEDSD